MKEYFEKKFGQGTAFDLDYGKLLIVALLVYSLPHPAFNKGIVNYGSDVVPMLGLLNVLKVIVIMVMELTHMQMEANTLENGKTVKKTDKELIHG